MSYNATMIKSYLDGANNAARRGDHGGVVRHFEELGGFLERNPDAGVKDLFEVEL